MSCPEPGSSPTPAAGSDPRQFQTTQWTALLSIGADDTSARAALSELCAAYWYPLYAFIRRSGYSSEDAEDLTQGFFAQLLEQRALARVVRGKGRFRSYLLGSLKHFLAHERERGSAQKRGGGVRPIPLDLVVAENFYGAEPADHLSPDHLFDRRWAVTILERALAAVQREFVAAKSEALFEALRPALTKEQGPDGYAAIAHRFQMSEGAVKTTVHRLRRRYRAALRSEITRTVANPEEVDAELRDLFAALG